jgi:hypothetical protein
MNKVLKCVILKILTAMSNSLVGIQSELKMLAVAVVKA